MRKNRIIIALISVIVLAVAATAQTAPPAQGQEKKPVDTAKLYAEIVGSYSYDINGQSMIMNFWVENGKLYAAPQGEESKYAEVILKDAEKLFFEATPPGGRLFEIEFARGESKKIEKSVLRSEGMEAAGIKIK